jgi:hypothetical protein
LEFRVWGFRAWGSGLEVCGLHDLGYTDYITTCKTDAGFFLGGGGRGGGFSSSVFQSFCPFFCASKFCLWETLISPKEWRANEA